MPWIPENRIEALTRAGVEVWKLTRAEQQEWRRENPEVGKHLMCGWYYRQIRRGRVVAVGPSAFNSYTAAAQDAYERLGIASDTVVPFQGRRVAA